MGDERLPFMDEEQRSANAEAPSTMGLLARTFGALLLIIGLIVAAAYGMRRFGGARFGAPRQDAPELSVLTSVALGDRRSLAVVRFGERTLLVGSTAQAITLLATGLPENEMATPPVRSVADILKEDEASSFAEELSLSSQRLAHAEDSWSEHGGEA